MPPSNTIPWIPRSAAYAMMVLSRGIAWTSLLAWMAFVLVGPLELMPLGLTEPAALALDACLSLAFFVQHSVMIRRSFRQRSAGFIPSHYQGAVFSIVSGIVLWGLVVFWQASSQTLAVAGDPVRWLLRATFVLALVGFAWGILALRLFDPFGLEPIRGYLRGRDPATVPFCIRGPYRWVRHPLYLFMLLMIWSAPDLTLDRLLFNVLWSGWIIVAAALEERDLVAIYGEPYRHYQRRVPMLIPYRRPQTDTGDVDNVSS